MIHSAIKLNPMSQSGTQTIPDSLEDIIAADGNTKDNAKKSALLSPVKAIDAATTTTKVKRLSLITSEDLRTPTIALPTIAVSVISFAVWGSILYYGAYKRKVSPILTFPVMTAACFASFTPVHDATHSSVAKGAYKKSINNFVGYFSGIPLILPFGTYRQLHLLHHRYTNTDRDPDVWDARGPMVIRFLKWFIPDVIWIRMAITGKVKDAKLLDAALYYLGMFWLMKKMNNKGMAFVKYWVIPQRTAYWLLMWLFAYVPHRPDGDHQYSATDNVYKMTNVTGGILNSNGFNLAIPLLNQHLHNIHHLYPQLPFTRYGAIWAKHKDALIAAGTEIHPVYSSKQGWKWDENLDGTKRQ